MRVRVGMVVALVMSRTVLMLVLVAVIMAMVVSMAMLVTVLMFMSMFVVMGAHAYRSFSGQSASAILTHQSISKEANSISRPARRSPLKL